MTGASNTTTLESITLAGYNTATSGQGNGVMRLGGVRLDGRILVDGPADNSQNWSDKTVATNINGDTLNPLFDGNTSTQLNGASNIGVMTLDFTEINYNQNVEIFVQDASTMRIGVNSGAMQSPSAYGGIENGAYKWLTILSGSGSLDKIQLNESRNNAGFSINAIKIDDKILVDAGAQWDQRQVWSSDYTNAEPTVAAFAFDGDLTTQCYSAGTADAYFSISDITATKVECYGFSPDGTFYVDGSAKHEVSCAAGWVEVYSGSAITVNKLGFTRAGGSGGGHSAWRINDKILVDPGTLGDNGFYLPFDPAQTGANYSSQVSGDIGDGKGAEYMFDGDLSGSSACSTSVLNQTLTWDTSLAVANTVEIFVTTGGGTTYPVVLTGSEGTTTENVPAGYSPQWFSIDASSIGTLTKMEWTRGGSGQSCEVRGVKIDGKLLVDHSSIGNDASGNGNHFQDENFSTVTGNTSEVWSGKLTLNRSEWNSTTNYNNKIGPTINAFDGTTTVFAGQKDGAGGENIATLTPDNNFTSVTSLRVYVRTSPSIDNSVQVYVNGDTSSKQTVTFKGDGWFAYSSPPATISEINISSISGTAIRVAAFEINNEILTQPNTLDTVLDTPMRNYMVLEEGRNGNLVVNQAKAIAVSFAPAAGKYYYEVTTPVASTMPAQTNLFRLTTEGSPNIAGMRPDGSLFNATLTSGSGVTSAAEPGDVFGIAFEVGTTNFTVYRNGVEAGQYSATNNIESIGAYTDGSDALHQAYNFGQQPYAFTAPADYVGLYQTWEQYARTTLGYALDRIAKLEALRLIDTATIADLRTQIAGALSRISSIESDEVNDDAVDSALITLVGSLNGQVTAWASRIATAEAAIAAAESRITTLES